MQSYRKWNAGSRFASLLLSCVLLQLGLVSSQTSWKTLSGDYLSIYYSHFFFCIHALAGSNSFLDWVTSPFGIVAAYNYFGPFWVRLFIGKLSVCALQNGHFQN
jgi:hypothetical protein